MKRKYLFIVLTFTFVSLAAYSGVFAVCIERRCNDTSDTTDCIRAKWEYDDCMKREREERAARKAAAEQEEREKAEKGAVKEPQESKKYQYPFMEDIREINKKQRNY